MKLLVVLLVAVACTRCVAQSDEQDYIQRVIKTPKGDVRIFNKGLSPDGHYGVGDGAQGQAYGGDNCFVDIREKKTIDLPSDRPYESKENHAEYGVFWSPGTKFARYCLMQNQKRFATYNLFLIRMDQPGMSQVDIVPRLEKAVRPVLQTLRPLYYKIMAISYPNSEWDDVFKTPVFHATTVDIQFNADLPKAGYDQVTGWVTVSLPEGKVLKVDCDAKRDDPFQDDATLAKADADLNRVYALLQKQLDPTHRAKLRKEQLDWIKQRDDTVADDYPIAGDDVEVPEFTRERNKRLVDVTEERTGVLKGLLGK